MRLTGGTACKAKALPKSGLPPHVCYDRPRRRTKEGFAASFAFFRTCGYTRGSKIHFFGQAKCRVIELRGPQDSSGSALEYAEHAKRERAASHADGCKLVQ